MDRKNSVRSSLRHGRQWVLSARDVLFGGMLHNLRPMLLGFLGVNLALRLVLAAVAGEPSWWLPWRLLPALLIGAGFDLAVASFMIAPAALVLTLWPTRWRRGLRWLLPAAFVPIALAYVFVAVAEFTFWQEFASRFNFIAVDYLVYTNEVIGNIRESYNLPLLLGGVVVGAALLWAWVAKRLVHEPLVSHGAPRFSRRAVAAWLALPLVASAAMDARYKSFSDDSRLNELAGNGYFDFWHAFRHNELDYDRFYLTMPRDQAQAVLDSELGRAAPGAMTVYRATEREIRNPGPEQHLNVVMVSVESLSAEFMAAFGGTRGLTPHLDDLASRGMLFTQVYATGTRTVRGLEALSLSVPPTPGHAIIKRADHAGLFTAGTVFRQKGYEPIFLYGGYGYFDNMNAFYGSNGYTVVDRTALDRSQIHFENIWGVADEDLFDLTLRQLDARAAAGRPFFAHVMTTSNHRPFSYPAGRIDLPSGSGRAGGVKYTDWSIGRFIRQAEQRPWFRDTLFVIVADHTHKARGRVELPLENYHIPLIVFSPAHVAPQRVDTLASQIDVAPTIFGLLNFSYRSMFFGQDILREGREHPRALLANYQTVGYVADGIEVELRPNRQSRVIDLATGRAPADVEAGRRAVQRAVAHYQLASQAYRDGLLKERHDLGGSQARASGGATQALHQ